MAKLNQRVRRDTFVWAAILAGHGFLFAIVLRIENRHSLQSHLDVAEAMTFVWLALSPPLASKPRDKSPTITRAKPASRLRITSVPQAPTPQTAATAPEAIPPIDWLREGRLAAAAAAGAGATENSRSEKFSQAPKGLRKPCQPRKSSMEWQPPRFGMAGAEGGLRLPYVVLGKRCVLGLGFFGCDLGQLPEANSHLLDDMHDPDLTRSSTPAADSCD